MVKEPILLGSAKPLAPHPPADMLDLFMTRYDYDYNRDPDGAMGDSQRAAGCGGEGEGDRMSGAVRNRPIFALGTAAAAKDTTYRVDYVPRAGAVDMQKLVDIAYSGGACGGGNALVGISEGDGGVYAREWFTRPGATAMAPTDISIYKTDYTGAAPGNQETRGGGGGGGGGGGSDGKWSSNTAMMYPGASAVPYKADFLSVKGGAKEDDGADIAPKITSDESLKPRRLRDGAARGHEQSDGTTDRAVPSAAAAARYLMSTAQPPWVPGAAAADATVDDTQMTASRSDGRPPAYGQYSCESWLYGDTSYAHPNQLPQDFAGSLKAHLLDDIVAGSTRHISNSASMAEEPVDAVATLLRRLAGQSKRRSDQHKRPLALFSGSGNGTGAADVDETNPIYISPAEQRKCASRHRIADEGFVKGVTIYKSDYVDQGRLPELPGNPSGAADPRDTNRNARPTVGEMMTGTLTADTRVAAHLRNSHGTLLPNHKITEKTMSVRGSGAEKVAAAAVAALPPVAVVELMRGMERHDAVDRADPHRRKLRD